MIFPNKSAGTVICIFPKENGTIHPRREFDNTTYIHTYLGDRCNSFLLPLLVVLKRNPSFHFRFFISISDTLLFSFIAISTLSIFFGSAKASVSFNHCKIEGISDSNHTTYDGPFTSQQRHLIGLFRFMLKTSRSRPRKIQVFPKKHRHGLSMDKRHCTRLFLPDGPGRRPE